MNARWRPGSTAELIEAGVLQIGDGYRAKNAEFVEGGGLPFVRVGNVRTSGVELDDLDELPLNLRSKYEPKVSRPGDSLITMKGTVGRTAFVSEHQRPFIYSPQISYWRVRDTATIDPRWLRYWLEGPEFMIQALASKGATDMADYINLRDQRRMTMALPTLREQQAIADVLGAMDDLIENNRRRVEVLEEMARAIYREWFVHFRFRGHENATFVDSPLGPIPEGWSIGCIGDIVKVINASVDPRDLDPGTPAVGLEHIPRRRLTLESWGQAGELGSRKSTFVPGDVLFGRIRPYFHKVSVAPVSGICSTDAIVLRPSEPHWGQAVLVLASDDFVANAVQTSNGTKMPRADWKVVGRYPIAIPPSPMAREFSGMAHRLLDSAKNLTSQGVAAGRLRELLLPKLVTGEIDVSTLDLDGLAEQAEASGEDLYKPRPAVDPDTIVAALHEGREEREEQLLRATHSGGGPGR